MSIPVSGPYAEGHIIVVANKHAHRWRFETLEVEVNGQEERIALQVSQTDCGIALGDLTSCESA